MIRNLVIQPTVQGTKTTDTFKRLPNQRSLSGYFPKIQNDDIDTLPFTVKRTKGQSLPVYTKIFRTRNKIITVVKNYGGDSQLLARCISDELNEPVTIKNSRIEISGRKVAQIKALFQSLGF
eukprot:TRINITY_DN1827_c0_g1_i2.p1 TRINITY_DN1827_c0_g1~~TRINITY_DN1827_c0_g1_i2.p1  ORF type:complete len:122 (+),score=26.57 TRINITY_DN1827_c0_g1_i2:381-746(+)